MPIKSPRGGDLGKRGSDTETRRLWLDLTNAHYLRETLSLADCQIALRVDREVRADDGKLISHDTRYFITSLDPARVTADHLLRYVRDHWRVESLHFLKDRWWDEDRHHTRRPGLSALMAAMNNAAISIHRLCSDPEIPLRASADHIAWVPPSASNCWKPDFAVLLTQEPIRTPSRTFHMACWAKSLQSLLTECSAGRKPDCRR